MSGETPAARMTIYLDALRRAWPLALGVVLACVLGGVAVASVSQRSYEATAKVLVGQRAQLDTLLGASGYSPDPERELNTSLALITIEPVAEGVSRQLGLGLSAAALAGKVSAEPEGNSNVVAISVRDPSRARAARIANAVAREYRDFHARTVQAGIDDALEAARRRAEAVPAGPERDALDAERRQVEAAAAFRGGGVQVVRLASASGAVPVGGLRRAALLAGFLGLVLAAVLVIVLARTDRRLRREDEVDELTGSPALGVVPAGPPALQARDALAAVAVRLTLRPGRARHLLVTSPGPGEGTAEVTLGLARALGELGRRTIAIEADLRDPSFARLLGVEPADGLSAVLMGRRSLDDAIVDLAPATPGAELVSVVPAGDAVETPGALLAGTRMASLLEQAGELADVVLVAAGPAASGDSLTLVRQAQLVLVVARLDVTRRPDLEHAVAALKELNASLLGTVLTTRTNRGIGSRRRRRRVPPLRADGGAAAGERAGPSAAGSNGFHARREETTEVTK